MTRRYSRRSMLLGSSAFAVAALAGAETRGPARPAGRPGGPGAAASPGAQPGPELARLIANENPYGPSERARKAIIDSLPTAWQYPMGNDRQLKTLIAEREGLAPENVMVGLGSGEILQIAGLVFGANSRVVAAKPTFNFLQEYARKNGATIVEVPLDEKMRHDLKALAAETSRKGTGLLYVCNPNNPTGNMIPGSELRPFLAEASRNATVLVDEAYLDLWDDWREHTATDRIKAGDPVIVTRTFSKLHGMAGLRVGYGLASPDLIRKLEQHRMTIQDCTGLAAATASYQDLDYQAFSKGKIHEGLAITIAALRELGIPFVENTRGNFVFFDTGGPLADFRTAMKQAGYMIGWPHPPYLTWCRVSMGTTEQMQGFAAALRQWRKA